MKVVVRHPEMNSACSWGVRFVSEVSPVAVEALPQLLPCFPDVGRVTSLNSLTKGFLAHSLVPSIHLFCFLLSSHT